MTELANQVYGDFLTENPAVAQSAFGPHRVIPDRWKGMSPEQIADIKRQQELQRKEKQVCILGQQLPSVYLDCTPTVIDNQFRKMMNYILLKQFT